MTKRHRQNFGAEMLASIDWRGASAGDHVHVVRGGCRSPESQDRKTDIPRQNGRADGDWRGPAEMGADRHRTAADPGGGILGVVSGEKKELVDTGRQRSKFKPEVRYQCGRNERGEGGRRPARTGSGRSGKKRKRRAWRRGRSGAVEAEPCARGRIWRCGLGEKRSSSSSSIFARAAAGKTGGWSRSASDGERGTGLAGQPGGAVRSGPEKAGGGDGCGGGRGSEEGTGAQPCVGGSRAGAVRCVGEEVEMEVEEREEAKEEEEVVGTSLPWPLAPEKGPGSGKLSEQSRPAGSAERAPSSTFNSSFTRSRVDPGVSLSFSLHPTPPAPLPPPPGLRTACATSASSCCLLGRGGSGGRLFALCPAHPTSLSRTHAHILSHTHILPARR